MSLMTFTSALSRFSTSRSSVLGPFHKHVVVRFSTAHTEGLPRRNCFAHSAAMVISFEASGEGHIGSTCTPVFVTDVPTATFAARSFAIMSSLAFARISRAS